MSPVQCVAARKLLQWSCEDLESEANVKLADIISYESNHSEVSEDVIASIETAFEYAGIEFIGATEVRYAVKKTQNI